ncbi:hypothetical protein ACLOJK_005910 [Asimina triloba]
MKQKEEYLLSRRCATCMSPSVQISSLPSAYSFFSIFVAVVFASVPQMGVTMGLSVASCQRRRIVQAIEEDATEVRMALPSALHRRCRAISRSVPLQEVGHRHLITPESSPSFAPTVIFPAAPACPDLSFFKKLVVDILFAPVVVSLLCFYGRLPATVVPSPDFSLFKRLFIDICIARASRQHSHRVGWPPKIGCGIYTGSSSLSAIGYRVIFLRRSAPATQGLQFHVYISGRKLLLDCYDGPADHTVFEPIDM